MVWIHPRTVDKTATSSISSIKKDGRATYMYPDSLLSLKPLNKLSIECTTEVPMMSAEILDIDLDFFTANLNTIYPNFMLKRKVFKYIKEVRERISGVRIVTIALSPGYIQSGRECILLESTLDALIN